MDMAGTTRQQRQCMQLRSRIIAQKNTAACVTPLILSSDWSIATHSDVARVVHSCICVAAAVNYARAARSPRWTSRPRCRRIY